MLTELEHSHGQGSAGGPGGASGAASVPYGDCLCCRRYFLPTQGTCLASPIPGHALAHPFPTANPSAQPGAVVRRCEWPDLAIPCGPLLGMSSSRVGGRRHPF